MALSSIVDIDRDTGELIQGWPRARRAIKTIVQTRFRTRLMRLYFGSNAPDLQDKPGNEFEILKAFHDIADAVNKWEPEFRVTNIHVDEAGPDGDYTLTVDGVYLPEQKNARVQVTL